MAQRQLSDATVAALGAFATLFGGLLVVAVNAMWIDAGTQRETDVQLVSLAINILSEPISEVPESERIPNQQLRAWAVDTINAVADVKFGDPSRQLLIEGTVIIRSRVQNPSQTPLADSAVRLGEEGALLAMPFLYQIMKENVEAGTPGTATDATRLRGIDLDNVVNGTGNDPTTSDVDQSEATE